MVHPFKSQKMNSISNMKHIYSTKLQRQERNGFQEHSGVFNVKKDFLCPFFCHHLRGVHKTNEWKHYKGSFVTKTNSIKSPSCILRIDESENPIRERTTSRLQRMCLAFQPFLMNSSLLIKVGSFDLISE